VDSGRGLSCTRVTKRRTDAASTATHTLFSVRGYGYGLATIAQPGLSHWCVRLIPRTAAAIAYDTALFSGAAEIVFVESEMSKGRKGGY
jgi:hypothetical protein